MIAELTTAWVKVGGLSLISFRDTTAFPVLKRPLEAPSMSLHCTARMYFSAVWRNFTIVIIYKCDFKYGPSNRLYFKRHFVLEAFKTQGSTWTHTIFFKMCTVHIFFLYFSNAIEMLLHSVLSFLCVKYIVSWFFFVLFWGLFYIHNFIIYQVIFLVLKMF